MLERWRQHEPLPEGLDRLVGGEAGADRGDLEEDAARLAEVDRAEPEAVDYWRRPGPRCADTPLPGLVVLHRRRPGDVVDSACAPEPALLAPVVAVGGAARLAAHLVGVLSLRREAERLREEAAAPVGVVAEGAHAVEALERVLLRDLRVAGDEGLVRGLDDTQLEAEALRIGEREAVAVALDLDPLASEPVGPEVERRRRGDPPGDRVDHPDAGVAAPRTGVLEEGDVGPRATLLVGVEEVIDGRVVLVDRLLDHPQPEHARIEVDVARRVPGDARDVVDAVEPHAPRLAAGSGGAAS